MTTSSSERERLAAQSRETVSNSRDSGGSADPVAAEGLFAGIEEAVKRDDRAEEAGADGKAANDDVNVDDSDDSEKDGDSGDSDDSEEDDDNDDSEEDSGEGWEDDEDDTSDFSDDSLSPEEREWLDGVFSETYDEHFGMQELALLTKVAEMAYEQDQAMGQRTDLQDCGAELRKFGGM